jgi:hypothetical protein
VTWQSLQKGGDPGRTIGICSELLQCERQVGAGLQPSPGEREAERLIVVAAETSAVYRAVAQG